MHTFRSDRRLVRRIRRSTPALALLMTVSLIVVGTLPAGATLDSTFASGGVFQSAIAPSVADAYTAGDGSIVAAGNIRGDVRVWRLTGAGVLDPSFGTNGTTTVDLGGADTLLRILPGPAGTSVLIVRSIRPKTKAPLVIVRLLANGKRDMSFGFQGVSAVSLPPWFIGGSGVSFDLEAARLLPDGRLSVSICWYPQQMYGCLQENSVRIAANGRLDPTVHLNLEGTASHTPGRLNGLLAPNAFASDGRGWEIGAGGGGLFDLPIAPDGALAPAFRVLVPVGGGLPQWEPNSRLVAKHVDSRMNTATAFDSHNRPLVAYLTTVDQGSLVRVMRLNVNGTVDTSFGTRGAANTFHGKLSPVGLKLSVDGQGRVIVVGVGADGRLHAARLTPNGRLDSTFSGTGSATVSCAPPEPLYLWSARVDPAGRLVVLTQGCTRNDDWQLTRLDGTGHLDATFGNGGHSALDTALEPTADPTSTILSGTSFALPPLVVGNRVFVIGRGFIGETSATNAEIDATSA